jgi:hypothetical protein
VLYSIYGLLLDVDFPVPGLSLSTANSAADVRIELDGAGGVVDTIAEDVWYRGLPGPDADDDAVLTIFRSRDHGRFRLRYPDGVEFLVNEAASEVRARWPAASTLRDVAVYLTGPVLGFLLRQRGVVALHASVVAIDGHAVAFVGPSGAGKSTTAAALARRGYPVITEDIAALWERDGAVAVRPGCRHIGLWPDSVAMLFGSADALPPFTPGWEKRCFDLSAGDLPPVQAQQTLRSIYLISDEEVTGTPRITPVSGRAAMMALLGNIYGSRLFHRELRVRELDLVRTLAASLPVKRVSRGPGQASIDALCDAVLDDLTCPSSGPGGAAGVAGVAEVPGVNVQSTRPGGTRYVQHR